MTPGPLSSVLHTSSGVLAPRHVASWMLLTLAAGGVNAGALMACDRFVTHVTGTLTRTGTDFGAWILMLDYALVVLAFLAGAMASVLAIQARVRRGRRPLHALPMVVVAAVLLGVGIAGKLGVFGPIGGEIEETTDFALLSVLAFAMGLMNATVSTSTALAVRTTHMTGPTTDFGVHLATAWISAGTERAQALRAAALRGGKIACFALGAGLMLPMMGTLGHLAFAVPAVFVLVATARSFLPAHDLALQHPHAASAAA
jgi:uncharacterized membrane protein YoaK (UPF0700 family)